MARETKADLLKQIEELRESLRLAHEANDRLIKQNSILIDNADKEFENSCTYTQMKKEIDTLNLYLKTRDNTIKTYQNRCVKGEETIQELKIENKRLNSEIVHVIADKNNLSIELDKVNKSIELDNKFYKDNETMKNKLDETLILSTQKTSKILKLEKEIEEYRSIVKRLEEELKNNDVQKIKNERNAGRKSKIDDDIIRAITMLKLQNKSVRAISKEIGLSVGTVHKIIKEHIEEI